MFLLVPWLFRTPLDYLTDVLVAVLLEVVERVELETPVLREAVVVGWSVANVVREVRPRRAA